MTLDSTIKKIRHLAGRSAGQQCTDRQLLHRFANQGDEEAFATLVHRHAALVLSVCRRVVGNLEDAEDAFQATFLVLARKADAQNWQPSIGNWLHGVAYRIALKARTAGIRRRLKENAVASAAAATPDEALWTDVRRSLDEELNRLPARYRAPLVLCYLEGKTRDEAAEELGWSTGSVKGRLERGRELLRQRLSKRGLTLHAALCAGLLAESSASAAISPALGNATIQSAVHFASGGGTQVSHTILSLAQGALNAMLISKLKTAFLAVCAVVVTMLGTSAALHQAFADGEGKRLIADGKAFAAADDPVRKDANKNGDKEGGKKDGEVKEGRKDGDREKKRDGEKRDGDKRAGGERDGDGNRGGSPFRDVPRGEDEVVGWLSRVDLEKGTITVAARGEGGQNTLTFSLAGKDIKVTSTTGAAVELKELRPGLYTILKLRDEVDVISIRVQPPVVRLNISEIFPDKGEIRARINRERESKLLKVLDKAWIQIHDQPASLAKLTPQDRVLAMLTIDGESVSALRVDRPRGVRPNVGEGKREGAPREGAPRDGDGKREGKREGAPRDGEGGELRVGRYSGVIVDIDHGAGTFSVLVGRDDDLSIKQFKLAEEASIKLLLDDRHSTDAEFKQLGKAVRVSFGLTEDGKMVKTLHAVAPRLRTVIKSVDPVTKRVTVGGGDQEPAVLQWSAEVLSPRSERPITLENLRPGTAVLLSLSLDRQHIVAVQILRREGRE